MRTLTRKKLHRDFSTEEMFHRTFAIETKAIKEDERRVSVSFSSEQPYSRYFGVEILQHDANSIDFNRLNEIGVSLFNHNRDYILGKLENIKLDEATKKAYCDIIFDDDDEAEKIYRKVSSGTLKGVSVGYFVDCWEEVAAGKKSSNGRFEGPAYIATKWTPFEVSIVSVPADDAVGVNRNLENNIMLNNKERTKKMDPEQLKKMLAEALEKQQTAEQVKIVEDLNAQIKNLEDAAVKSDEEVKAAELKGEQKAFEKAELCRKFELKLEDFKEKSIADVKEAVLKKFEETKIALPGSQNVQIIAEEGDKFRTAAVDGLLIRAGHKIEKPAEGANEFRSIGLQDLARECLSREGENGIFRMSPDELFRRALTPSSAFMSIVDNVVSKSMSDYATASTTYQLWTGKGTNKDFKEARHYRMSEAGKLELVPEGSEVKFDKLKDEKVTKSVATYAKKFGLTREAFINDDLNVISKMPVKYTRAAYQTINALVYKILTANAAIYDGVNLFDASTHKNLASSGTAITTAALATARAAMKKQKDLGAKVALNLTPQFIIVSPDKELEAAQLLKSSSDPSGTNAGVANIYQNLMQIIVDAELTGNAWYLATNAMDCDTIEVTNLSGYETPQLTSRIATDFLGIEYQILMDAGVTALDFRGLYKNAGA